MFKYSDTGKNSKSGEKQVRVPASTRNKQYINYIYKKGIGKKVYVNSDNINEISKLEGLGYKRIKTIESSGWEIVKEMIIDPRGPNKGLLNVN